MSEEKNEVKVEAPKPQEAPVAPKTAEKEKPKKEKPTNCAGCNKSIRKKRWYYRNGKNYCTKRCWLSTENKKKEEKAAAEKAAQEKAAAEKAATEKAAQEKAAAEKAATEKAAQEKAAAEKAAPEKPETDTPNPQ